MHSLPRAHAAFFFPVQALLEGGGEGKEKRGNEQPTGQLVRVLENFYCTTGKTCAWVCLTHEIQLLTDHGLEKKAYCS